MTRRAEERHSEVRIPSDGVQLQGELRLADGARSVVLFAHGSGSSRHSPRNQHVAEIIRHAGIGTLLFDLLTPEEETLDMRTGHLRFDIGLLERRLIDATRWLDTGAGLADAAVGYFGASTGGGAALVAAAELDERVGAVVSRGGRPDLAGAALARVSAPTLLIVGGLDNVVIGLNREAYERLSCRKELRIVAGATHLFEEPGTLDEVARLARVWFERWL